MTNLHFLQWLLSYKSDGSLVKFTPDEMEQILDIICELQADNKQLMEQINANGATKKPLLADAKVGDLCQRRDAVWGQVDRLYSHGGLPVIYYEIMGYGYMITGQGLTQNRTLDITHWEHLAPEGTAEWALQMMKLGKKVQHESYSMPSTHCAIYDKHTVVMFITPAFYTVIGNPVCHINDWLRSRQIDSLIDERIGWRLYEPKQELVKCEYCSGRGSYISSSAINPGYVRCPTCNGTGKVEKPAPAFKVGDWVEYMGNQRKLVGIPIGETKPDIKYWYAQDVEGNDIRIYADNITRKLSPSEVVIDFGSFKGTIELNSHPFNKQITVKNIQGDAIAYINIEYLDTPTRELVRELIKKQEEK